MDNCTVVTDHAELPERWRFQASLTGHPIIRDEHGVYFYKPTELGGFLRQYGGYLNNLWIEAEAGRISKAEVMQHYRDIGYSLAGFEEVFYEDLEDLETRDDAEAAYKPDEAQLRKRIAGDMDHQTGLWIFSPAYRAAVNRKLDEAGYQETSDPNGWGELGWGKLDRDGFYSAEVAQASDPEKEIEVLDDWLLDERVNNRRMRHIIGVLALSLGLALFVLAIMAVLLLITVGQLAGVTR